MQRLVRPRPPSVLLSLLLSPRPAAAHARTSSRIGAAVASSRDSPLRRSWVRLSLSRLLHHDAVASASKPFFNHHGEVWRGPVGKGVLALYARLAQPNCQKSAQP